MRVLLVTPSFEDKHRSPGLCQNSHYPIGLASIKASLVKAGHEVNLLFLNDYPQENCMATVAHWMATWRPEAVCIQMMTHNRSMGYLIANYIRSTYKTKLYIGGIHATVMAEQVHKAIPEAVIVKGGGEITLPILLKPPYNVGEHIVDGIEVKDLDNLPMIDHKQFKNPERTVYSMLTSRGCPFKCSFCMLDSVSHRRVRYKSVERVVAEVEEISKIEGCQGIWIHDDNFLLDNDRAIKICDEIRKKDLKIGFCCSARVKPLTQEVVDALESIHVGQVLFGFESCAESVLSRTHKGITKQDIMNAVTLFKDKKKISPIGFLMVGLPGETRQTIKETGKFIQDLKKIRYLHYEDIGVTMVYPGTEIYEIAKAAGDITDDYWLTQKEVPYFTTEHSEEALFALKSELLEMIR